MNLWKNANCKGTHFHDGADDVDGLCTPNCIASFYEEPTNPNAKRDPKTATCKAPDTPAAEGNNPAGLGNGVGVWTPSGCKDLLDCKPGKLSSASSTLAPKAATRLLGWIKQDSSQKTFSSDVRRLEQAAKMGDGKGPAFSFEVVTKDLQGEPRNYHNLGEKPKRDYLVAVIERVPYQLLPAEEQSLQPRETLQLPSGKNKDAEGTWTGETTMPYGQAHGTVTSESSEEYVNFASRYVAMSPSPQKDTDQYICNVMYFTHT